MGTTRTALFAILSSLTLLLPGCGDSAEAKQMRESTKQALDDIATWSAAKWNDFVASSEKQLQEAREEANRLREQLATKSGEASKQLAEKLDALDAKLDAVGRDVDEMARRGSDAGGDVAQGVSRALDEIGASIREAEKSLADGGTDAAASGTKRDG